MLCAFWQRQAVEISEWNLHKFRLSADPRTHRYIAVSATREARIHGRAVPGETAEAVLAESARHVEWHHHTVADLAVFDGGPNLDNHPHVFVTENDARLCGGSTLVHVQIRSTYARRSDFDYRIVGMPNLRIGYRFDRNFKWFLVYNRFQWIVPCLLLMMNCLFSADDFQRNYRLRFRFCL
jgi:hypothetical protein